MHWTMGTIPSLKKGESSSGTSPVNSDTHDDGDPSRLVASSPVSPIFSTHARKEGEPEPGIQNHVTDVCPYMGTAVFEVLATSVQKADVRY